MPTPPGGVWRTKGQILPRLMNRLNRFGFTHTDFLSAKVLANLADTSLFKAVLFNENHSLICLFPNQHFTPYFLRARPHSFNLPDKDSRNFISRMLFLSSY